MSNTINMFSYYIFNISSAEQSKKSHSFANVVSEGMICPEIYWDIVGLDTPIALAISLFVFPENSISFFKRILIFRSKSHIYFVLNYSMI